ncbi:MAG TPA: site-2 protease family protein [Saprospiraceae bacterium]|nr:site-2 protease family protein [Saprospiraceae bacterium]HMQ83304.1 site-2 protease family protein [Saprospiraceae bacterium]
MRGAFQIARVFGIPVQIHWTFLLVFVWVFTLSVREDWGVWSTVWAVLFVMALFFCVVLHEFGHALTARRFGVATRDIILSPIGGVARLDKLPERPWEEFLVAIAGPLVNIAIVFLLSAYPLLSSELSIQQLFDFFRQTVNPNSNVFLPELSPFNYFILGLISLNFILALFNMLPAFPMDGGRVLRALLSIKIGRLKATYIAANVGKLFALVLIVYGIWEFSLLTSFIGLFVFVTASNEYRMVKLEDTLSRFTVSDILRRNFTPLFEDESPEKVQQQFKLGAERNFLVFDEWQNIKGILTEQQLAAIFKNKRSGKVAAFQQRHYEPVLLQDSLKIAWAKMQWSNQGILPVYDKGRLVGVADEHGLNYFLKQQR